MRSKIFKNSLVKNTMILIIGNMFIKMLALSNRIILTRLLGNEGISLYMITLPSIMLFISIGGLSINIAVTKLTAEKQDTSIIKRSLKIIIFSSIAVGLVLLILAKTISYTLLKQPQVYIPILISVPLITLSAINSVYRGYYNGLKKVSITTASILIEQITRISASIILLLMFINKGIIFAVSISIFAMIIGEICSIIFVLIKLRKYKIYKYNNINGKEILNIAIPITATRLMGNITYFLEPIIFTFSLSILNYNNNDILYLYSETTAYTIPLITMFSFLSYALASAIIPYVATAHKNEVPRYITKSIFFSIIPSIPITLILYLYADEFMYLIYNTNIGSQNVSKYCIFFILYYIQSPLISIMQATNQSKKLVVITGISDVLKLLLLFFLPFITKDGLIIAFIIPSTIITITLYFILKRKYNFKFTPNEFNNFLILSIVTIASALILKVGNINYLLSSILIIIVFLLSTKILNILSFNDE